MKILLSILLLLLCSISSPAQTQPVDKSKLEDNLYYRALVAMLAAQTQDFAKLPPQDDSSGRAIIVRDLILNDGFPTLINDVAVEYLALDDLRLRYQKQKRRMPIYVMRPMTNKGDRLIIDFTRYWFSATRKTDMMALEGGYRVTIGYDSSQRRFVIERTELWGI